MLNGDDPKAFLHEALHIYHGDLESSLPVDQIEAERHRELSEMFK